jgi:hypothetical protein
MASLHFWNQVWKGKNPEFIDSKRFAQLVMESDKSLSF